MHDAFSRPTAPGEHPVGIPADWPGKLKAVKTVEGVPGSRSGSAEIDDASKWTDAAPSTAWCSQLLASSRPPSRIPARPDEGGLYVLAQQRKKQAESVVRELPPRNPSLLKERVSLGCFKILKEIGAGSFGKVYQVKSYLESKYKVYL